MELAMPPGATRTLDGSMVAVGADPTVVEVGVTVVVNETLPEKRLNVFTVIVELADWLTGWLARLDC